MIVVNGMEYRTLSDEFFVNGRKVYEAYANGVQVYPEPLDVDSRNGYVVATGEGSLLWPYDPDSENSPYLFASANVTWIVRFRGSDVHAAGMGANISGPRKLDDGNYFQVWTIIEFAAGSAGEFSQNLDNDRILKVKATSASGGASGTYELKRPEIGSGVSGKRIYMLRNMGDLGYAGRYGRGDYPSPYDLGDLAGFYIQPTNPSSSSRDVECYISNGAGIVSFKSLELGVGYVYEIELTGIRIYYTPEGQSRAKWEWIDPRDSFGIKYYIDPYTGKKTIAYSNSGGTIYRDNITSSTEWAKPYLTYGYTTFRARPSEVKVYMPGEDLPDAIANINSIEDYDYRPVV